MGKSQCLPGQHLLDGTLGRVLGNLGWQGLHQGLDIHKAQQQVWSRGTASTRAMPPGRSHTGQAGSSLAPVGTGHVGGTKR